MPPSGGTAAAVVARWWQQGVGDHRVHRTWLGSGCPAGPRFFNFSKLRFFLLLPNPGLRAAQVTGDALHTFVLTIDELCT